jgi:hypothetical protein
MGRVYQSAVMATELDVCAEPYKVRSFVGSYLQ